MIQGAIATGYGELFIGFCDLQHVLSTYYVPETL